MDDRTYRIAWGVLGVTVGAIALDAALVEFSPPTGVWTVLAAVAAFLGARSAFKNGNGGPK